MTSSVRAALLKIVTSDSISVDDIIRTVNYGQAEIEHLLVLFPDITLRETLKGARHAWAHLHPKETIDSILQDTQMNDDRIRVCVMKAFRKPRKPVVEDISAEFTKILQKHDIALENFLKTTTAVWRDITDRKEELRRAALRRRASGPRSV